MNILKKYNDYLKGEIPEQQDDAFTKKILQEYFEEVDLKNRWREI